MKNMKNYSPSHRLELDELYRRTSPTKVGESLEDERNRLELELALLQS